MLEDLAAGLRERCFLINSVAAVAVCPWGHWAGWTDTCLDILNHANSSTPCVQLLAAVAAALAILVFGELAWWCLHTSTGDPFNTSQGNTNTTEAAILAMGDRIEMKITNLDYQYRGKLNKLYKETQNKLDSMDELLRIRLTTASTTTTTINTIFNRFKEDKSPSAEMPSSESEEVGPHNIAAIDEALRGRLATERTVMKTSH